VIAGLLWLPVAIIVHITRRFVVDSDSSDLSDTEWNASRLFKFAAVLAEWVARLVSWGVVLLVLVLLDSHPISGPAPAWALRNSFAARGVFLAVLVFGYPILRIVTYFAIEMAAVEALEKIIASKIGPETGERYYQFALKLHGRNSSGLDRLLVLRPPRPRSRPPL
jgi:hypothetical protein